MDKTEFSKNLEILASRDIQSNFSVYEDMAVSILNPQMPLFFWKTAFIPVISHRCGMQRMPFADSRYVHEPRAEGALPH